MPGKDACATRTMKTERLYYNDSKLFSFDARVLRSEGDRVVLDRTAFYPTSGGQPFDIGTLGGARVLNVEDNDDDEVIHFLDQPITEGEVHGEVDAVRRFDHMQQHTGQHLLSAVFIELFQFPTVSFHLGDETCTIDLSVPKVSDEQVVRAEAHSNALIVENRAVRVSYRSKDEVAALGLRKETKRDGEIRLVEIEGLDLCACGGTHVRATGEIGAVLLRKVEKVKQGMRVEFVCGHRAVRYARRDFTALTQAASLYSAKPHDLPEIVARKLEETKAAERERKRIQEALGAYEAKEMYEQAAPNADGLRVVERIFDTGDPNYLRFMAGQIARQPAARAVFALRQPPTLILAQSRDLTGAPDLGAMVKQLGLRGGGTKESAQGGAATWDALEQALAVMRLK
jgi:alanyl-tRNA synthetase